MIRNYLTAIEPAISVINGAITGIKCVAWAAMKDFEPVSQPLEFVLAVPADADGVFTEAELTDICMARAEVKHAFFALNASLRMHLMPEYKPPVIVPPTDSEMRALWAKQIDASVRLVSDKFTCFQMEYVEREAAATTYKESGFTSEPSEWITIFADSAKIPYPTAAQLILNQAVALRAAIKDLGDLRMQKYRVLNEETQEAAKAEFERIIEAIRVVEENLP